MRNLRSAAGSAASRSLINASLSLEKVSHPSPEPKLLSRFGIRWLPFLKNPTALEVVQSLGGHPSAPPASAVGEGAMAVMLVHHYLERL